MCYSKLNCMISYKPVSALYWQWATLLSKIEGIGQISYQKKKKMKRIKNQSTGKWYRIHLTNQSNFISIYLFLFLFYFFIRKRHLYWQWHLCFYVSVSEFKLWNKLVIFILFQKSVAGWFRVFNSDLHCVGGEEGEGDQNCGRGTSHCQSCIKKHPPSHRLGCPRQQCVYNADCTEMGSGGLWGSSNCITTNSTKVKPKLHKAPFILSSAQPVSSHCFPAKHWPSLGFLFKTVFIFRLMWTVCLHNMFHSCNILLRELTGFSTQEEVSFYSWDDVNMLQIN